MIINSKLVVGDVLLLFARWRYYFTKLIQISYDVMFSMKWLCLEPNLVRICSIYLKLQAVKQSVPVYLAYPVHVDASIIVLQEKTRNPSLLIRKLL